MSKYEQYCTIGKIYTRSVAHIIQNELYKVGYILSIFSLVIIRCFTVLMLFSTVQTNSNSSFFNS